MKTNQIPLQINRNLRNGFTLVELMVAMALIILMLSIMSQAFVIATGTMQGLKEVADMQEKIRPAITLLQRDLGANHFEGSKKLSDPEFWDNGPPKEGYFMLWQDNAFEPASGVEPSGDEGAYNGVSFRRSAAFANHMLAFTVKLPGKSPNEYFESSLSSLGGAFGNTFFNGPGTPLGMTDSNIRRFEKDSSLIHSDWAEVAYFLGPHEPTNVNYPSPSPDGYTDGKAGPALPYFNLYRQQRLVLPSYNIAEVNLPTPPDNATNRDLLSELSFHPGEYSAPVPFPNPQMLPPNPQYPQSSAILKFNNPNDLTVPWKRMGNRSFFYDNNLNPKDFDNSTYLGKPIAGKPLFTEITNGKVNTDIIATNVISFDVKFLTDDQYDYEDLFTIGSRVPYKNHLSVSNYISQINQIVTSPSLPHFRSAVFDTWTLDQGGIGFNQSSLQQNLPQYDFGTYIYTKWRPFSNSKNVKTIPFWNWNSNTGLNIKAVQISLRIWDQKSNTAKMFVVVQKL